MTLAVPTTIQSTAVDGEKLATQLTAGELDPALAELATIDLTHADIALYRAFLERQRGLYDRSVATIDAHLLAAGPGAPALLQRAYSLWLKGELGGAARDFERAAATCTDAALSERLAGDRASLEQQLLQLAPVRAAKTRLDALTAGAAVLVAAAVVALLIQALRRPA